jgi:hypothetical protein
VSLEYTFYNLQSRKDKGIVDRAAEILELSRNQVFKPTNCLKWHGLTRGHYQFK